ncbi:MAG: GNAT family N-acetyltransferase [Phycisphaeraceae bacterium]|nr:GNAT family N-acetyltransferase [Phycisphaeraceae bacterium]MBX3367949.1 GNAT family N-acetyltransferase [Phycisphaeraceae bacterium]QYK48141.1 MAG: GNAT family N-acetyltransferase [Phycisphaeraceae bacterium]
MNTVRSLTSPDIEALVALRAEALLDSPWAFTGSPGEQRDADLVRGSINPPRSYVVGAFDDAGALVASAGIVHDQRAKRAHVALIWGVYVTPRARGRGTGRTVVSRAVEVARAMNGVTTIQLACSENSTAAAALYRSLGFVHWGTEPDAIRVGGRSYNELHMSLPNP